MAQHWMQQSPLLILRLLWNVFTVPRWLWRRRWWTRLVGIMNARYIEICGLQILVRSVGNTGLYRGRGAHAATATRGSVRQHIQHGVTTWIPVQAVAQTAEVSGVPCLRWQWRWPYVLFRSGIGRFYRKPTKNLISIKCGARKTTSAYQLSCDCCSRTGSDCLRMF